MKWVTRARPVIDRIACPWLIARFIDEQPEFLFVDPSGAGAVAAEETGAIPYDVPGVELSHVGECAASTRSRQVPLEEPALHELARIVRGADTRRLDLTPQAAGLLAISLGPARSSRTTSRCCATASCCTTHSTSGAGSSVVRATAGHQDDRLTGPPHTAFFADIGANPFSATLHGLQIE